MDLFSPNTHLANLHPSASAASDITPRRMTPTPPPAPASFEPRSLPTSPHMEFSSSSILSTESEVFRAAATEPLAAIGHPIGGLVDDLNAANAFKSDSTAFAMPSFDFADSTAFAIPKFGPSSPPAASFSSHPLPSKDMFDVSLDFCAPNSPLECPDTTSPQDSVSVTDSDEPWAQLVHKLHVTSHPPPPPALLNTSTTVSLPASVSLAALLTAVGAALEARDIHFHFSPSNASFGCARGATHFAINLFQSSTPAGQPSFLLELQRRSGCGFAWSQLVDSLLDEFDILATAPSPQSIVPQTSLPPPQKISSSNNTSCASTAWDMITSKQNTFEQRLEGLRALVQLSSGACSSPSLLASPAASIGCLIKLIGLDMPEEIVLESLTCLTQLVQGPTRTKVLPAADAMDVSQILAQVATAPLKLCTYQRELETADSTGCVPVRVLQRAVECGLALASSEGASGDWGWLGEAVDRLASVGRQVCRETGVRVGGELAF